MGEDVGPGFEDWVLARRSALLRSGWLLTGSVPNAEDLVQTALLRCWPKWSRIRRVADIDAYVRRVMINAYLSDRRRRWSGELPSARVPDRAYEPADADADADDRLLAALRRLPRGQRAVVVLRFAEDLSETQTATLLDCSVGTVKSQTARGLAALRADSTLLPEDLA